MRAKKRMPEAEGRDDHPWSLTLQMLFGSCQQKAGVNYEQGIICVSITR